MNLKPSVGILTATYNGEKWVEEQIESIIKQINVEIKIFVSDDKSEDTTPKILADLSKQFPFIKLVPHSEKFGCAAKNFFFLLQSVDLSEFDYVAFADQDDVWDLDKLTRHIMILNKKHVDAVSSDIMAFWPDGRQEIIVKSQNLKKFDYMFESAGPGCTFLMTKALAHEIQKELIRNHLIHKVSSHDWFFYAFARSKNYSWHIDSKTSMLYRQHGKNVLGANSGITPLISRFKKLKTGWFEREVITIARCLEYDHLPPIKKLSRIKFVDRIFLALHVCEYRRRFRDQIALAIYFLFIAKK